MTTTRPIFTSHLLDSIQIETAANPTHAVIWLHGLGADGHDFAPIVSELDLRACPPIRFVFPHAHMQPVTINGGMAMRSWYDIVSADLTRREDADGIRASEQQVRALIARENTRGIACERIVLAGFSQGCAMTLHTGLRLPQRLAGLIGLSGDLPLIERAESERDHANDDTPILLAHGEHDPVVALARAQASRDRLQAMGYQLAWRTYPMAHSVCSQEISDIAAFLRQVLLADAPR